MISQKQAPNNFEKHSESLPIFLNIYIKPQQRIVTTDLIGISLGDVQILRTNKKIKNIFVSGPTIILWIPLQFK